MTRRVSLMVVLGLAAPLLAGGDDTATPAATDEKPAVTAASTAPIPAPFTIRQIDFGLSDAETNTNSSRFREYRAVPTGVVLPFARFAGNQKFGYDVVARNVLQTDARYAVRLDPGDFVIKADYQKIPHRFGNDGHSLLSDLGPGALAMSDTLQQAFQDAVKKQFDANKPGVSFPFLDSLVGPSLAATSGVELRLLRERGSVELRLTHDKPLDLRVSYFQEKRRGDRAAGTSFGFGNVVETPEPIDYRTRDFGITGEWTRSWGLLRGGFHYNDFANRVPSESFDNPFRATDSTDPSAYTAPGAGSIGGPAVGRVSLPPDNKAVTGSLGFLAKFAGHSRVSADASFGQWTQDEAFMAMTTNSAIKLPEQGLPGSLDGKIKTFSLSTALTSRPVKRLNLAARFRRYDLTNDTPQVRFPDGYVRFDAVFEDIPRISVPYGYVTDALALSASYDLGAVTVEGGYKLDHWDRTFRETETTHQNLGYLKADLRASDWLLLRGTAEKGTRDFRGLEIERSEDASFLKPGAPANLLAVPAESPIFKSFGCSAQAPCNLRFDQSKKAVDRYGAYASLSPGGKATLTLSYLKGKDDFEETRYGLVLAENEAITAEIDYSPVDRANVFGFYTRENVSTFQRGRQSGATVSTNPKDDWTADIEDRVDSFGLGTTLGLVLEKVDLKLWGNYQKVDGNNDITSAPGGAPALARIAVGGVADIPFFDDTKLYTLSGELAYRVTRTLRLGLGGWYEKYVLRDSNSNDATGGTILRNYVPGSFFLAANDHDYEAHVLYVRASYVW